MAEVKKHRSVVRCQRGAQLIEFAFVLPLLMLVILGIAEFGFVFQRYEVLTNAAREGARIAVLPGYLTPDVELRVRNYLGASRVPYTTTNPAIAVTNQAVAITGGATVPAKRVTLTYTYTYSFIKPIAGWFGAAYTTTRLTAVSEMRIEVVATP